MAWFLAVWLVLVSRGYTSLGLQWSAILGAVAGMLVTAMVILRFVCLKLHKHNWRDLELN